MKVINLLGGPGSGKSTTAAGLFYEMKKRGINAELVTEYAKDLVYDGTLKVMLDRQEVIFAEQNQRLHRLRGKVDYAIVDSPLLLSVVFPRVTQKQKGTQPWPALNAFNQFVYEVINTYDNEFILLKRNHQYDERGREHTEEQSNEIEREIASALIDLCISYHKIVVDENVVSNILTLLELNTSNEQKV